LGVGQLACIAGRRAQEAGRIKKGRVIVRRGVTGKGTFGRQRGAETCPRQQRKPFVPRVSSGSWSATVLKITPRIQELGFGEIFFIDGDGNLLPAEK